MSKEQPKALKAIPFPLPGHGGEFYGAYMTIGKGGIAKKKGEGPTIKEGIQNRKAVKEFCAVMRANKIPFENITKGSPVDFSIKSLVKFFRLAISAMRKKNREPVIIDFHMNGMGNGKKWHSANGLAVWCDKRSKRLAELVHAELWKTGHWTKDRGVKVSGWFRGKLNRKIGILLGTDCQSILIEPGFFTNEKDSLATESPDYDLDNSHAIITGFNKWKAERGLV